MTRLINPGKRLPDPKGEPDFYDISRRYPLPEDSSYGAQNDSGHGQRMPTSPIHEASAQDHHNPSAQWGYPDAKRQRQDRQYAPPVQPADFAPYGLHPGFEYGYGYGQYHYPTYPPYPHPCNYPPGPFGEHFGHPYFQNPYMSPGRPHSHAIAQQQWPHHHSQYANVASETGPSRREDFDVEHEHQLNPSCVNKTAESAQKRHTPSGQSGEPTDVREKPPRSYNKQNLPPVIHRGSSTSEKPVSFDHAGHGRFQSSRVTTQYVFPSYGASPLTSPEISYQYPPSEAGAFNSATGYASKSSYENQEEQSEKPIELDERKPAANRSPVAERRAPTAQDTSMTPVRNNQRLEWTESFSDHVCNYLLEDNDGVQRPTKNEEEHE